MAKEDVMEFLVESFETSELIKIERSRWSKTKGIGIVDHRDVDDLEMALKDKNTVNFNFSSGSSITTTTAGKAFNTPPSRVKYSDSFANSAITFGVASTVAQPIEIEDESSISSIYNIGSMG